MYTPLSINTHYRNKYCNNNTALYSEYGIYINLEVLISIHMHEELYVYPYIYRQYQFLDTQNRYNIWSCCILRVYIDSNISIYQYALQKQVLQQQYSSI